MPNIKSAKKRVLVAEARNARNKAERSAMKTAVKKFEVAAAEGNRTEPRARTRSQSRPWIRPLPRAFCTRTMPLTRRAP